MSVTSNGKVIPSFSAEAERLKAKQRRLRDGFPENLNLRVHRSLSWLVRAAELNEVEDQDTVFILLWIAFNSVYGQRNDHHSANERTTYKRFFDRIISIDDNNRIFDAIWRQFAETIRNLLRNQYVFEPYWRSINAEPPNENWKDQLKLSNRQVNRAFSKSNTSILLALLFDRLYVLRNQVLHGGATWKSNVNRGQILDGVRILAFLVPIFVELMMDRPNCRWSKPYYHNLQ